MNQLFEEGKIKSRFDELNNQRYLILDLSEEITTEKSALATLRNNSITSIIKAVSARVNGIEQIQYNVSDKKALSKITSERKLNRDEFIKLALDLTEALQEAELYQLDLDSVYLHDDYIFINNGIFQADFIYIPIFFDGDGIENLKKYLVNHIINNNIELSTDNFLQVMLNELRSTDFSISRFQTMLKGLGISKQKTQRMQEVPLKPHSDFHQSSLEETMIDDSIPSDDASRPYFEYSIGSKVEMIVINKDKFRLGHMGDFAPCPDMRKISREQADVLCKNGEYYIKDLNSKNGTYIVDKNGQRQRLDSNKEYLLKPDMRISLASELILTFKKTTPIRMSRHSDSSFEIVNDRKYVPLDDLMDSFYAGSEKDLKKNSLSGPEKEKRNPKVKNIKANAGEMKSLSPRKIIFIVLQAFIVLIVVILFRSGFMVDSETGQFDIIRPFALIVITAGIDFVVYRELFVNNNTSNKEKNDDENHGSFNMNIPH